MLDPVPVRLESYLRSRGISVHRTLGYGKDGSVWESSRRSAIKIHERPESYHAERNAYMRLRELNIREVAGFAVPLMYEYDDELSAIEMDVVSPPFVVDFASARLDAPPEMIEDEGHTLEDMIRERFGAQADQVLALYNELIARADIFLSDFHRHNIRFSSP